jgi:hypothetical protein
MLIEYDDKAKYQNLFRDPTLHDIVVGTKQSLRKYFMHRQRMWKLKRSTTRAQGTTWSLPMEFHATLKNGETARERGFADANHIGHHGASNCNGG